MLCLFVYNHHLSAWLREVITQTPTFTINLRESVASNLLYQSVFIILQQLCFSIHFMHSYMSSPLFFAAGCPSSAEPPVTADHVHFAHWTGDNQDILATRSVPSVTTLLRINSDLPLPLFRLLLLSTKLAVYLGVPQEKKRKERRTRVHDLCFWFSSSSFALSVCCLTSSSCLAAQISHPDLLLCWRSWERNVPHTAAAASVAALL